MADPFWKRVGAAVYVGASRFVVAEFNEQTVVLSSPEGRRIAIPVSEMTEFSEVPMGQIDPLPVLVPEWFKVGVQIVPVPKGGAPVRVIDLNLDAGWFEVSDPELPHRRVRFQVGNIPETWRLYSNLEERPLPRTGNQVPVLSSFRSPPPWLVPRALIRTRGVDRRRAALVEAVLLDRQVVRVHDVVGFSPVQIHDKVYDLTLIEIAESWEILDSEGVPLSELTCPTCRERGVRKPELEDPSVYSARVYECSKDHRWSFISGGINDGQPAVTSRFERIFT